MKKMGTVFHVPQSDRFLPALKMARNLILASSKEEFEIKIIVNFEGITVLKNFKDYKEIFQEVLSMGIEVYFCENAMKGFNISKDLIPEGSKVVPAGIKFLLELQAQGYFYVRP